MLEICISSYLRSGTEDWCNEWDVCDNASEHGAQ